MYSYNITFVIDPEREQELLRYINDELRGRLFNEESPAMNPHLKKVVEAGGEKPGADHGLSMALSADFLNEEQAHLWNDHILLPALGDFHLKFGVNALFFITLLEMLY